MEQNYLVMLDKISSYVHVTQITSLVLALMSWIVPNFVKGESKHVVGMILAALSLGLTASLIIACIML